jgi:DNA repair protein SbcD/Mre11
MLALRFLQISDLHADSSFSGSKLNFSPSKKARLRRDIEAALTRAMETAQAEQVDVVLCPGDLWDDESVTFQSATFIYDAFASIAPIPVVITPGNHDPFNAFSYHNPRYYQAKVSRVHPRNVTVFSCVGIERRTLPDLPDVDFYGNCFEQNRPRNERVLAGLRPQRRDALNVLLLHGSLDRGPDSSPDEKLITAPFSTGELIACGFDYAALGHYHKFEAIHDDSGTIRGAYGGIPVARGLDELSDHYILLGTIEKGGVRPETLRKICVDPRRIRTIDVEIDSTVLNAPAAHARVARALDAEKVSETDIVHVILRGRIHPNVDRFEFDPDWMDAQCFHLSIDQSGLEPEYHIESLLSDEAESRRIEGAFVRRMKQLLDQSEGNPERVQLVRTALCCGLDALRRGEVGLRNVY